MADEAPISGSGAELETRRDLDAGASSPDAALWEYWEIQESIADREERDWLRKGRRILKRYRDERSTERRGEHLFNILWSNVQTLKPAVYGRTPKASCERRWKDQDDVGRLAGLILERSIEYSIENHGFDGAMRASVDDLLLPGRGAMRVLYVPHFGDPIEDEGEEGDEEGAADEVAGAGDEDSAAASDAAPESYKAEAEPASDQPTDDAQPPAAEPEREVVWEEARVKYVHWTDYRESPARQWDEVTWVRYRAFMTRDELRARFGKKKAKAATLDFTPRGSAQHEKDGAPPDAYKKCIVFETWDKTKKEAVWWAPGTPGLILDKKPDPLRLRGFFPGADPLLATTTTDTRVPVPDYHEYQDQAEELDTLSARIERLQRSLKVFGLYPGDEKKTLAQLVNDDTENLLIPVADWQGLIDKGGMEGVIQWFPIKEIAEALIQLYNARDRAKQVLYEITGIADIIRGATAPEETATAQQIKTQFATLRLSERQKMVARFARDTIRLVADLIGTHFSEKTISLMTGYPQLLPLPQVPAPPQMPPELALPPTTATMIGHNGGPPMPPAPPSPAVQAFQQAMQAYQQAQQQLQATQAENARRQQQFEAAVQLLREDVHADFRIDIEADSTIQVDENAEKQARTEFLQQMVPLLEQVIPLAQGVPPMAALAKEIVLFAARAFKTGRTLEEALEAAFDAIAQMPQNPKAQGRDGKSAGGNDPAMAQAKMQDSQLDAKVDMQDSQNKLLAAQQANAIKERQVEGQLAIERDRLQAQLVNDARKAGMEHDRNVSEQALREARVMNISSKEAGGLV